MPCPFSVPLSRSSCSKKFCSSCSFFRLHRHWIMTVISIPEGSHKRKVWDPFVAWMSNATVVPKLLPAHYYCTKNCAKYISRSVSSGPGKYCGIYHTKELQIDFFYSRHCCQVETLDKKIPRTPKVNFGRYIRVGELLSRGSSISVSSERFWG